jgi:hypothetical protein
MKRFGVTAPWGGGEVGGLVNERGGALQEP